MTSLRTTCTRESNAWHQKEGKRSMASKPLTRASHEFDARDQHLQPKSKLSLTMRRRKVETMKIW